MSVVRRYGQLCEAVMRSIYVKQLNFDRMVISEEEHNNIKTEKLQTTWVLLDIDIVPPDVATLLHCVHF